MNDMSEQKIPALRFPEFSGEWEEKQLEEIVIYKNGKAHENDIDLNGVYIVVNSKYISSDSEVVKYTNKPLCIANKNDILMVLSDVPNGRALAKCLYVRIDNLYTVNQRICKLTPKGINGNFLFYYINKNPYFLAFNDGVNQTNLRKQDVLDCNIYIPKDEKEQEKIASCLNSVDKVISCEEKRLELMQRHKKGLMQKLFPRNGETVPQYRFLGFEGEWEEKRLGEIANSIRGQVFSKSEIIENGVNLCIHYGELFTKYGCVINTIYSKTNTQIRCASQEGDLLFPNSDVTPEGLARCSALMKDGVLLGGDIIVFRPKYTNNSCFLSYEINANKKQILKYIVGIAVKHISQDSLSSLVLYIPPTIQEQEKIARCLNSVDKVISYEEKKLELMQRHKKGLMQKLFPQNN